MPCVLAPPLRLTESRSVPKLRHATSEIASSSKLGIDAAKKQPGEGFKRPWPPLIEMDERVKAKIESMFNERQLTRRDESQ